MRDVFTSRISIEIRLLSIFVHNSWYEYKNRILNVRANIGGPERLDCFDTRFYNGSQMHNPNLELPNIHHPSPYISSRAADR